MDLEFTFTLTVASLKANGGMVNRTEKATSLTRRELIEGKDYGKKEFIRNGLIDECSLVSVISITPILNLSFKATFFAFKLEFVLFLLNHVEEPF